MAIEIKVCIAIGCLAVLLIYRFLYHHIAKTFLERFLNDYVDYLKTDNTDELYSLVQRKSKLKKLLHDSNISIPEISYMEEKGYGYVSKTTLNVIDNIQLKNKDIYGNVMLLINEGIGFYRDRRNENINPLFWIDFTVRLPKYLLEYFNWNPPNTVYKSAQVAYWLAWIAFAFLKVFSVI